MIGSGKRCSNLNEVGNDQEMLCDRSSVVFRFFVVNHPDGRSVELNYDRERQLSS